MSVPKIDKSKCIGCGTCVSICGQIFEMGKDNKSQIKKDADCDKVDCCQEAKKSCPVGAISLE